MQEWQYAHSLHTEGKMLFRIPIIVRPCPWLDVLDEDDVKALPRDGKPMSSYKDVDVGWNEVYEGIKSIVEHIRASLLPRQDFLRIMQATEFLSHDHIDLQEIYEFPELVSNDLTSDVQNNRTVIRNLHTLLEIQRAIVHGPEKAGKTALARHIYLSLVAQGEPVLYVDLEQVGGEARGIRFREAFNEQFHGDYDTWSRHADNTLIVDNLSAIPRHLTLLELAENHFAKIIVFLSTDMFSAFFRDELRLARYSELFIAPLTYVQQEKLIRRRLEVTSGGQEIPDGLVDEAEDRVNSIIISDKILPRYPFFVLAILQTYETFMPANLSITSYGHCYYVLIVASLIRSGISNSDDEINACFNFASHLARAIHTAERDSALHRIDFPGFVTHYRANFHIREATINRLRHEVFGILGADGQFKSKYMYYYFLGKYLADGELSGKALVSEICERSHVGDNYLILLFTIHHTNAIDIIEDILTRTMLTLGSVEPAKLTLTRQECSKTS